MNELQVSLPKQLRDQIAAAQPRQLPGSPSTDISICSRSSGAGIGTVIGQPTAAAVAVKVYDPVSL